MFKRKLLIMGLTILAVLITSVLWASPTKATPGLGVTAELLASGNLPEPIRVKFKDGSKVDMDVTQIRTYRITIAPGGVPIIHQC